MEKSFRLLMSSSTHCYRREHIENDAFIVDAFSHRNSYQSSRGRFRSSNLAEFQCFGCLCEALMREKKHIKASWRQKHLSDKQSFDSKSIRVSSVKMNTIGAWITVLCALTVVLIQSDVANASELKIRTQINKKGIKLKSLKKNGRSHTIMKSAVEFFLMKKQEML